jgi:hypothetical protein
MAPLARGCGDFERRLEALASKTVITPRLDAETRRGRDYVLVTLTMTIMAGNVAEAVDSAWRVFQQASRGDGQDWDVTSASAEVLPEKNLPCTGITPGFLRCLHRGYGETIVGGRLLAFMATEDFSNGTFGP